MLWHQLACKLKDPDADFLLQLVGGVRLGVNETLTPSPAWPSSTASIDEPVPLLTCDSAWKSALDHPDVVASLVQDEIDAGFIVEVADGLEALQRQFSKGGFWKIGCGDHGRACPSSGGGQLHFQRHCQHCLAQPYATSKDCRCADGMRPDINGPREMVQLTMDVSKARRRILIHPEDAGLLCFHANGKLYRCATLHFGARASGWYWGRVAGLMVRCCHALLSHSQLMIFWLGSIVHQPHFGPRLWLSCS